METNIDNAYINQGMSVIGVDEAGRGPLCGPVVVAAVQLTKAVPGLDDSKRLTEKRRLELLPLIVKNAVWAVFSVRPAVIDRKNILGATLWGMERTARRVLDDNSEKTVILFDGNRTVGMFPRKEAVVGGDAKSASIAAASIIAKSHRDRIMRRWAQIYPEYGLDEHKGYPTTHHYDMLEKYGPTPIHRKSFRLQRAPAQTALF